MERARRYHYTLETISNIILSPRAQNCFYQDIDFSKEDLQAKFHTQEVPKIIYPFYQYGAYQTYAPQKAQYYIPGSSIKGAMNIEGNKGLQVDDIRIENDHIRLDKLSKVQHIPTENSVGMDRKAMRIDDFFPNMAMEMLQAKKVYEGDFYYSQEIFNIFEDTRRSTKEKIEQLLAKIAICIKIASNSKQSETENKCKEELKIVSQKLHSILAEIRVMKEDEIIFVLGGYKGRLLSGIFEDKEKGSIFIDKRTELPYGLVRMKLYDGKES